MTAFEEVKLTQEQTTAALNIDKGSILIAYKDEDNAGTPIVELDHADDPYRWQNGQWMAMTLQDTCNAIGVFNGVR